MAAITTSNVLPTLSLQEIETAMFNLLVSKELNQDDSAGLAVAKIRELYPNNTVNKKPCKVAFQAAATRHSELLQVKTVVEQTPISPPNTTNTTNTTSADHSLWRRGNIDQVSLHTKIACAKGHGLIRFETQQTGLHKIFKCDLCKRRSQSQYTYGCDDCNYDVCESCSSCPYGKNGVPDGKYICGCSRCPRGTTKEESYSNNYMFTTWTCKHGNTINSRERC